jgi:Zn-dependent peptidase ImmA (M78 family)/transcriptional regulator with XRE-family HTH domain
VLMKRTYDLQMGISLAMLGAKLAKYREQLQESAAEVAALTGIDPTRLIAIEAGAAEPTGDDILILADHFQCDFKFFISNERVAPFEQTETLYRAHGQDFTKADRRAVQEFLYLCETEAFLMAELGRPGSEFSYKPKGTFMKAHGEDAAHALRAEHGYSDREVPRDVYNEFRRTGVHLFRRHLGNSEISGLFINHPVAGKCALINYSEDVYRQRFSAAHEMAHAVFDSDQTASVSYYTPRGKDLREIRANRFASCFLMPPAFLAGLPDPSRWSDNTAVDWANKLRVSCHALGIALCEAQLVDEARSQQIQRLRVPRDAKVDPELPEGLNQAQRERKVQLLQLGLSDFYVALCFDALNEGVISVGRLAEALLTNTAELSSLASLYGRNLYGH